MLLKIPSRTFTKIIVSLIVFFGIVHVIAVTLHIQFDNRLTALLVEKFSLEEEGNFPTYFASLLLLMSSVLFVLIGWTSRTKAQDHNGKYWLGLSGIFLFLSLDEAAQIHEKLDTDLIWGAYGGTGFLAWPWVIIYASLATVLMVAYFKFWLNLPKSYRMAYLLAAIVYVGSALGFEMLEAWEFSKNNEVTLRYIVFTTLEEFFEMAGISLLIFTNMRYLADMYPDVHFSFAQT